ncbi:MAG: S-methyl-5'-thioadenosine phosphorylase [Chloroflexi bacterium CG_4_9_14_3_um_filter_45_9]|nr:MAG: methylthioadenosine phosphorylase [Dehalococcoidia bacterium CG2_30_46_9]PIU23740.1 MAG: S-methyl-5'-thioadenosine phosphorylase [Chloroflexi bacterium CG08_land_8_20_14_0_20_45_12]PJB49459.1 MAG: S-methyl-5'-thioadenosine phosphorylase [Chloroflexi bacterium CG_4_9_14_3_um_filter_45_9]
MPEAKIGIIGGSGLYKMVGMSEVEEVKINTPFGEPSDAIILGKLKGVRVAFLPRHGKGHRISPSELPTRANIYALKSLGVERIISVSAVGSLREEIKPLHLVIPNQLIDITKGRDNTFFSSGIVGHISFAEPFCPVLSQVLFEAATKAGAKVHQGGTYLAMEGPQFSTKAEAQLYRSWGADIIGMTACPEAKLAREAEICYATIAFVTDYDCWHPSYALVTTEMILTNLEKGVDMAKKILKLAVPTIPQKRDCACATALKDAIATSRKYISDKAKQDLDLLIGKYLSKKENAR